ncbi:anti-sigma factor antagonist [bacterium]|nr:anti-sigma factor antagonist [bacterium]
MAQELAIVLKGEIDHHRVDELKTELDSIIDRIMPKKLILDFKNVSMMDSSGIGLILGRYKKVKDNGGDVYVKKLNKQVDKIFEVSGLYQVIKVLNETEDYIGK